MNSQLKKILDKIDSDIKKDSIIKRIDIQPYNEELILIVFYRPSKFLSIITYEKKMYGLIGVKLGSGGWKVTIDSESSFIKDFDIEPSPVISDLLEQSKIKYLTDKKNGRLGEGKKIIKRVLNS